jgi:hypothetical protein
MRSKTSETSVSQGAAEGGVVEVLYSRRNRCELEVPVPDRVPRATGSGAGVHQDPAFRATPVTWTSEARPPSASRAALPDPAPVLDGDRMVEAPDLFGFEASGFS